MAQSLHYQVFGKIAEYYQVLRLIKLSFLKDSLKDTLSKTTSVFSVLAFTTCLLVLFFQNSVHAQNSTHTQNPAYAQNSAHTKNFTHTQQNKNSYTDPTANDLRLANRAVSECPILESIIDDNKSKSDILASEAFVELQKTQDGQLLIDNEACRESILEFVKSLCSSNSPTNNLFCERLGIQKSVVADTYKTFGQSAIDELGIDLADDIDFELNQPQQEQSKIKFLAAGVLFYLSPVKKLRFIPTAARAVANRVKPVLNGALLVLATLGLSSCGDAAMTTGPELVPSSIEQVQAQQNQQASCSPDDFILKNFNQTKCIKIPKATITYIDSEGNELSKVDTIQDHSIKIQFNAQIGYVNSVTKSWRNLNNLAQDTLQDMFEIKLGSNGDNLLSDVGNYSITVDTDSQGNSYVIFDPQIVYSAGTYTVVIKNYATELDAPAILKSDNKNQYLARVRREFFFSAVQTACARNEPGYFSLAKQNGTTECIRLPEVNYSVTTDAQDDSKKSIRVEFDSRVVFTDGATWNGLNDLYALKILDIRKAGGGDLTLYNGSINREHVSVTQTDDSTIIDIEPPTEGYEPGHYTVRVLNYATRQDVSDVIGSTNKRDYFNVIDQQTSFMVGTACSRNEAGYLQLGNTDNADRCIKLPEVTTTFTPKYGQESTYFNGNAETVIKFKIDSEIMFLNDRGESQDLTKSNFLDMLMIVPSSGGSDLAREGGSINQDRVRISKANNQTVITIKPPAGISGEFYPNDSYFVSFKNYVNKADVDTIVQSGDLDSYLAVAKKEFRFNVSNTACASGSEEHFLLNNSDGSSECIQLPKVSYTFTPSGGSESNSPNGDPTSVIKVKVRSSDTLMFLDAQGESQELTKDRLLDMLYIAQSNGSDLARAGGSIDQDQISVETNAGGLTITIEPPNSSTYSAGDYVVRFGNYAKRDDVDKIVSSDSLQSYLERTLKEERFTISQTQCGSGEFQLVRQNGTYDCIRLPEVNYTFTRPEEHNTEIKIQFDSEVVFINESGKSVITKENLRNMVSITPDVNLSQDRLSVNHLNNRTTITIQPPTRGYQTGDYEVRVTNYAKKFDVEKILRARDNSRDGYIEGVNNWKEFRIVADRPPCSLGSNGQGKYEFILQNPNGGQRCIELPRVEYTFNPESGGPYQTIKIKFNSEIVFVDESGQFVLGNSNADKLKLLEMIEMDGWVNTPDYDDNGNFIGVIRQDFIDIAVPGGHIGLAQVSVDHTGGKTTITINPPSGGYFNGNYTPTISNYAKKADAKTIVQSTNFSNYLNSEKTKSETEFHIRRVQECQGQYTLENQDDTTDCITLPEVSYSFDPPTTNIAHKEITINFDSEVVFLDDNGVVSAINNSNLLEMIEIRKDGGRDIAIPGGDIDTSKVSATIVGGRTVITIQPPDGAGYADGGYTIQVGNYVKTADATKVSRARNLYDYLNEIIFIGGFRVGVPSCDAGQFELIKSDGAIECIALPEVSYTFDPPKAARDPNTVITINFDSAVVFVDEDNGWSHINKSKLLEMIEIRRDSGPDLVTQGRAIGASKVSVDSVGGRTVITIQYPDGRGYAEGNYKVQVSNYVKEADAAKVSSSRNLYTYLNRIERAERGRDENVFTVGTPDCRLGEFGLEKSDNTTECIVLPIVDYTFSPERGGPEQTITIKFDSKVVFVDESGHSAIDKYKILEMIEITGWYILRTSNPRDGTVNEQTIQLSDIALPGGPIGLSQVLVDHAGGKTTITIQPPSDGYDYVDLDSNVSSEVVNGINYTLKIANYAKEADANKIVQGTNFVNQYLTDAKTRKEIEFFVDADVSTTPCSGAGKFELTNANGSTQCVNLPTVSYNVENGGSLGSNKALVATFDSAIGYLAGTIIYRPNSILFDLIDMIAVKKDGGADLVERGGALYDKVSLNGAGTEITIGPPESGWAEGNYEVSIGGFVKLDDGEAVVDATNTGEYLSRAAENAEITFGVGDGPVSCRIQSQSYSYDFTSSDDQDTDTFHCGTNIEEQLEYLDSLQIDPSLMQAQVAYNRADPDVTYVIDVAFIISQHSTTVQGDASQWESRLERYISNINQIYQRSGINVRFRVVSVKSFSDYIAYLSSPFDDPSSLDGLEGGAGLTVLSELVPRIQNTEGADLVYGIMRYGGDDVFTSGIAMTRRRGYPKNFAARFLSVGSVNNFLDDNSFITTLAHEFGHNLGLDHDKATLTCTGKTYPNSLNFTGYGYGYGGRYSSLPIGTIMSYANDDKQIPLFSANEERTVSSICRADFFRSPYGYCNSDNRASDLTSIRIGDAEANASEALQYTIEDASNYALRCNPVSEFKVENSDGTHECITLPTIDITFDPTTGSGKRIDIAFNSQVNFIDSDGSTVLNANTNEVREKLLEMIEITTGGGSDLAVSSGSIGLNHVSVAHDSGSGNITITIQPPSGGYATGDYDLVIGNYVTDTDTDKVLNSDNLSDYLDYIQYEESFTIP